MISIKQQNVIDSWVPFFCYLWSICVCLMNFMVQDCVLLFPFAGLLFYRPHPKDGEGTVSQQSVGRPVPGSFPCLWSQVFSRGIPQFQILYLVSGPRSFLGVPQYHPGGVPQSQLGRGDTPERIGYNPTGTGTPALRQNSRTSTCYAADGMRHSATQEDFLVRN